MALLMCVDNDPYALADMTGVLEDAGHNVVAASSGWEAIRLFVEAETKPDVVVLDLRMPVVSGVAVARTLAEFTPELRFVVCSGDSDIMISFPRSDVALLGYVRKSELSVELPAAVEAALRGKEHGVKQLDADPDALPVPGYEERTQLEHVGMAMLLDLAGTAADADAGAVFQMTQGTRRAQVEDHFGIEADALGAANDLGHSPAFDLISAKRQTMHCGNMTADSAYANLLPLGPFNSCVGRRLVVFGDCERCVFLFYKRRDAVERKQSQLFRRYADLMRLVLERNVLWNFVEQQQLSANMGQLSLSMVHELSGLIGQVRARALAVQNNADSTARPHADRLVAAISELAGVFDVFLSLGSGQQTAPLRVGALVGAVMRAVGPTVRERGLRLAVVEPEETIEVTTWRAVVQHALLNVMLNACHWADDRRFRPADNPEAPDVWVEYARASDRDEVDILVSNYGPGIHKVDWERIFAPFVSTRAEGCGMGLFLARRMMARAKGRVEVAHSVVPGGRTTFRLTLPRPRVVTPQQEQEAPHGAG